MKKLIFLVAVLALLASLAVGSAVMAGAKTDPANTEMGVYQYAPLLPMSKFDIERAELNFGKEVNDDEVRAIGNLELDLVSGNGVNVSEHVMVTVGPLSETITMVEKGDQEWQYDRPQDGEGNIRHMTIDWTKGRFDIDMDKADLTGATNPVTISIQIGDDVGSASILMTENKYHWDYEAE
jgi:hypothetical protein